MEIVELTKDEVAVLEPLWQQLNQLHHEGSSHFKDHFSRFTFAERMQQFIDTEQLVIFAARSDELWIGYCIASVQAGKGEIDSLFIATPYQDVSLGRQLMGRALSWLQQQNCETITVSVAEGNEAAIPFYEKFGFRERLKVLQLK